MLDMLQGTCYGQDLLNPDGSVEDLCKACCRGVCCCQGLLEPQTGSRA